MDPLQKTLDLIPLYNPYMNKYKNIYIYIYIYIYVCTLYSPYIPDLSSTLGALSKSPLGPL